MLKTNSLSSKPWRNCLFCTDFSGFKTTKEFERHLREYHCKKEGGSYVCLYGANNLCNSLLHEGFNEKDYEEHIVKNHIMNIIKGAKECQDEAQDPMAEETVEWSVYDCTQNLPAVLNDPGRSRREANFFTKTWGDYFIEPAIIPPSPFLHEVTPSMFTDYLRKIARKHQSLKKPKKQEAISPPCPFNLSERSFPEIDNVPNIFLRPDFSLENLETFDQVLPWNYFEQIGDSPRLSSKLLQEKLSYYLDVVEVQIVRQISRRSQEFFNAMTSHDALKDQLETVLHGVLELRKKIGAIDGAIVQSSLQVLALKRRRDNYAKVYSKLQLMATLHQTQPTVQLLLSTSDYVGALDLIRTSQEVLVQELPGVVSFRHLGSQLSEIQKVIHKMMDTDFSRYVAADLNRPLQLEEDPSVMEEGQLLAIMSGMLRLESRDFVDIFQEEACTAIKTTIKQTVIEALAEVDDLDQETYSCKMSDLMQQLSFPTWLAVLNQVFSNITLLLRRIEAIHKVMMTALQSVGDGPIGESSRDEDSPSLMLLSDCLGKLLSDICNHAHNRCARLLSARIKNQLQGEEIEQNGSPPDKFCSGEFIQLVQRVENFSTDCEDICGRRSPALRLALQTHANKFVTRFHEERKTKLGLILESEEWKQADVPPQFQHLVDHISQTGLICMPPDRSKPHKPETQKCLLVDGEKYTVVGSVLLVLEMVAEYCQCAQDVPMVAPDLLTRLLDFLKLFNSRTWQLVLGAQAIPVVRVITARHLAMTSRSLQLMAHYLPLLEHTFQHHLLAPRYHSMCHHFSHLLKNYENHVHLIASKLVSITETMFESHLSKWEAKPPVPSSSFQAILRQLVKVHTAVANCLPSEQVNQLFHILHGCFKSRLKHHLGRLKVSRDGGPQQGVVNLELAIYLGKLKLQNITIDTSTDDLWNS